MIPADPEPRPAASSKRDLLPYAEVVEVWRRDGGDAAAALVWTWRQVAVFRELVRSDAGWDRVLAAFDHGRGQDSWLATDWPSGFDELLLCAPLCQLVAYECARCTIGKRQGGFSCAHAETVFGRIGVLLQAGDRAGLLEHLRQVEAMLDPTAGLPSDTERPA